jgi:hypothetical protein
MVVISPFSILPWSAADADQGESFFLTFALPLRAEQGLHIIEYKSPYTRPQSYN